MARTGKMTKMKMSDGAEIGVYHAEPQGMRKGGLVLIQEIFGVTEHIMDCCDRFAAEGYDVLAPALYDRESPNFQASYEPEDIQKGIKLARADHPFDLSIKDAQTCINALKAKGPVFITGYCYGGSVSWAAACQCDGLSAASGYYGGNIAQMNDQNPKCPTILHFGKDDHGIPMDAVEKIRSAHPDIKIYVYEGCGHGFNSDRRTDYNAEAAKLAMQRTLDLFAANAG